VWDQSSNLNARSRGRRYGAVAPRGRAADAMAAVGTVQEKSESETLRAEFTGPEQRHLLAEPHPASADLKLAFGI
jgi:hypothetical protein